jgi:mannose-binding lectin 1
LHNTNHSQVKLPEGYYFGVSASSAENPDSFEIHKFIVSTTNSHTREEPNRNRAAFDTHQQQQALAAQKFHEQQTHHQQQQSQHYTPTDQHNIPQMLEDAVAGTIRSQQDQFADLHNRIQIINNRVAEIYELVENMVKDDSARHIELMSRVVHTEDRSAATMRNVEKVERTTMEILRDLESKDFKDMMQQIHRALENNHDGLNSLLPGVVGDAVKKHGVSWMTVVFVGVAVQIMVTGAYVVYKKRRGGAPKKYL